MRNVKMFALRRSILTGGVVVIEDVLVGFPGVWKYDPVGRAAPSSVYYGGPFGGNLVCEGFSAPFLRLWIWRFDWAALVLSWCSRVAT